MHKALILIGYLSVLISFPAFSQVTPSNIYLFKVRVFQDSLFEFTDPQFLTAFNRNGYNNHPSFFSNDVLFFSSQNQRQSMPDLYQFDLLKRTKTQITDTPEGEYSPAEMPNSSYFSAVRMEVSPQDTLIRIWQFPKDRTSNGKPIFKYVNDIGYYTWLNSRQIAAYRVSNPSYLTIIDVSTDQETQVASNIGRCLKRLPNGNLVFLQNTTYGAPYLTEYNPYNRQSSRLVDALRGSQDFVVLPNGVLLMGQGSKIYKFDKVKDSYWTEVVDLKFYDISRITRLAVSSDMKLAVVAE